jgi:molybdopterin/thiamine biosynthesis adenylyltransferase
LGVGNLVLVDGDRVEDSNLPRIVGAIPEDATAGLLKVDVAARYAKMIGSPSVVTTIPRPLDVESIQELTGCDLIVSCVDKHSPRALLNQFSYQMLIPTIDAGVGFRVGGDGRLIGDAGRVVIVGTERPCLACWGHINPDALREEALPEEERMSLEAEGYVAGAKVTQPAVMCFNGMVGNAAVIEVLRLVAGFADDDPVFRLMFSFSRAVVSRNTIKKEGRCRICGWK